MTVAMAKVLAALLEEPEGRRYGLDLMTATGLPSGTMYPILRRLQEAGWVAAEWELIDPVAAGRPARRYYRLTEDGMQRARATLVELREATTPRAVPVDTARGGRRARPAW
jgi:DNA-binding PadR family transcriptional regulator